MSWSLPLRVRSVLLHTQVNGPGDRLLLHLQGCEDMPCRLVCFNKDTHDTTPVAAVSCVPSVPHHLLPEMRADALALELVRLRELDGSRLEFTISGGEPTQQTGLRALLNRLTALGGHTVVYTGVSPTRMQSPEYKDLLQAADAWIAGPYRPNRPHDKGLRSSDNQRLLLSSSHYVHEEFEEPLGVEIHSTNEGKMVITGFPSEEQLRQLGA